MTIAARPDLMRPAPPRRVSPPDRIATTRAQALNGLDVVVALYGSQRFPAHFHDEFEVGVVTAGACRIVVRGKDHFAPAGSVVAVNPREVHAVEPADTGGWGYAAMFPAAAALRDLITTDTIARGSPRFRRPVVHDRELARRLADIHRRLAASPRDQGPEGDLRQALRDLLAAHADPSPVTAPESRAVEHIRGYLEQRHAEPIRLSQLSALTGLTLFHMVRVFRAATGLPPHAYLSQVRLGQAVALLRQGHPVSGVAFRTGFSDQSHLTRCFKRVLGVTPGQYRRGALGGELVERNDHRAPMPRRA